MKLLITGSAGMIGSVLARYFVGKGHEVVGVDNYSGGFRFNLDERVRNYEADVTDETLNVVFDKEQPEVVIHCAAYAAECLSPFIRLFNYENNLLGTANVINNCVNHGTRKLIFFSSMATYGDGNPPFKETDTRIPKDCYAIAKLAAEMDLAEAHDHFGLEYSVVIPHNVLSPFQNYWDRYRNVIAIWIRRCIAGEDMLIYGDGLQKRAFSDCVYICPAVEKLLTGFDGEAFNLGADEPHTILEIAHLTKNIAQTLGLRGQISQREPRQEVRFAYCNHSKAKRVLGFTDATDLRVLIEDMFARALSLRHLDIEAPKMPLEITKKLYSYWL